MIAILVYLISLPLTVYTLAGCLQIIDQPDPGSRFRSLMSLVFRLLLFALLLVVTPADARLWIAFAVLTVLVLTLGAQYGLRFAIRSGRWITDRVE